MLQRDLKRTMQCNQATPSVSGAGQLITSAAMPAAVIEEVKALGISVDLKVPSAEEEWRFIWSGHCLQGMYWAIEANAKHGGRYCWRFPENTCSFFGIDAQHPTLEQAATLALRMRNVYANIKRI